MKKETIKEIGKYHLDISKILAGLTIVAPVMKNQSLSLYAFLGVTMMILIGFTLVNKGAKDE